MTINSLPESVQNLVGVSTNGQTAVITLNRPKVNALNLELLLALQHRLKQVEANEAIRGVILTGGPGIFSAGLDIPYLLSLKRPEMEIWWNTFKQTLLEFLKSRLIVISAISGHSPAGGLVLSLSSDYRIMCSGNYKIGLNEVAVGIEVPHSVIKLARTAVGDRTAHYAFLSGRLFTSEEALRLGFIDKIVPEPELLEFSQKFLDEWLAGTTFAVETTKKRLRKDVIDALLFNTEKETQEFLDSWYGEKSQKLFQEFAAKLGKKKSQ